MSSSCSLPQSVLLGVGRRGVINAELIVPASLIVEDTGLQPPKDRPLRLHLRNYLCPSVGRIPTDVPDLATGL